MNWKIIAPVAAIIIVGILVFFLLPSEKKKIQKQFELIEEIASRHPGENSLQSMKKASKLASFFTDPCWLSVEKRGLDGHFPQKEIISKIHLARNFYSNAAVRFYDVRINLKDKKTAEIQMTMRLTGEEQGEYWGESHKVETVMKKKEGRWLFARVRIVMIQP